MPTPISALCAGVLRWSIALQILGPPAAVALAMCMVVENVLLFPLALALAEWDRDGGARWQRGVLDSLAGLAKNPMIVAIFAGFLVSLFAMLWVLAPIDAHLRMAAVIFASTPMLSIYPILAQRYRFEGFCAAALLVATLLSFVAVTISLWVMTAVLGWTP